MLKVVKHLMGLECTFTECAARACGVLNLVILQRLHFRSEGVSPYNLMGMRTSHNARVDQRIQPLDCQLGAGKPHHVRLLRRSRACQNKDVQKFMVHRDVSLGTVRVVV